MAVALDFGGKCISLPAVKCYFPDIGNLVINILPKFTSVRAHPSKMCCHFKFFILKRYVKLRSVICNSKTSPNSSNNRACCLVIKILLELGYRDLLNWISLSLIHFRCLFPSRGICDWVVINSKVKPTKTCHFVIYMLHICLQI